LDSTIKIPYFDIIETFYKKIRLIKKKTNMKNLIMFSFTLCLLLVPAFTQAQNTQQNQPQTIQVDPNDLDPATLAKIKAKQTEEELKAKISTYGQWVGIGKEVGVAVDEGLTAVTKHATAIADTRLGKVTMFIIAYKVIGRDIVGFIVGSILWIVGSIIIIISYFRNASGKKLKNVIYQEDGKTIKEISEEFKEGDSESQWGHVFIYACLVGVVCAIMFS
jgi:hypothetical protein